MMLGKEMVGKLLLNKGHRGKQNGEGGGSRRRGGGRREGRERGGGLNIM